jgi:mono/diheme cytochrome c family protein
MKPLTLSVLAVACLAITASPDSVAADAAHGKALHDKNCVACHDTGMYTRANRRVESVAALEAQIRRCDANLGLKWFDSDVLDVVEYLNSNFYKLSSGG